MQHLKMVITGAFFLFAILGAIPSAAQSPVTAPKPLRLNLIVDVAPSAGEQFDKAWGVIQMAAVERDFPFYTIVNQWGDKRWFLSVIGDYADLAAIKAFQQKLESEGPADVAAAARTLRALSLSTSSFISRHDPTLSYAPEGSYSGPYHNIHQIAFAPGKREALAAALARRKAAFTSAKVKSASHILWQSMGAQPDSVVILTSAPTPEEHQASQMSAAAADPVAAKAFADAIWRNSKGERTEFWLARPELRISPTLKKEAKP